MLKVELRFQATYKTFYISHTPWNVNITPLVEKTAKAFGIDMSAIKIVDDSEPINFEIQIVPYYFLKEYWSFETNKLVKEFIALKHGEFFDLNKGLNQ